ncbi:hypothetical protein [Lysinibacillus capsici]|uniref:hypothetical protein n=2 Tax=Lysinibacillus capsici TaxID=2115968 RepID=UPI00272F97DA|nr:hypothetical protein [Lysinibacillus capsici]MDP1392004.1 hypothetical protein [Lysinibacillus capsici]MDP1412480.1 hypothetical protein [Lysinibacillus capsici]
MIFESIITMLKQLEIKYTIRDHRDSAYISMTFEKSDLFNERFRYNLLIFSDIDVEAVSILIPSINSIMSYKNQNSDFEVLKKKIDFINDRILYGTLKVMNNKEVRYDYSFVYIDDIHYLKKVFQTLLKYIDFIIYEVSLLMEPSIGLEEFLKIREIVK